MPTEDETDAPTGADHGGDDRSARLAHDLATGTPPKALDTVAAAAEAADKADAQGAGDQREHRIRTRAYELWEREGRPSDRPTDFWLQAEAEIGREGEQD